jgi:large subunit ribosomal protein L32
MPVPKRKTSRSRRDSRSANKGIKVKVSTQCQSCSAPAAPHEVCRQCGHYKGRKILVTKVERLMKRAENKSVRVPQAAPMTVEASGQES